MKRIAGKSYGSGSKGFTQAHILGSDPVYLRKDSISCELQGEIETTSAYLGSLKAKYNDLQSTEVNLANQKEYSVRIINNCQDLLMNLGSMIFSSQYATYEDSTRTLLLTLEDRLTFLDKELEATEFIKWGADSLHSEWGLVTTRVRKLERVLVTWINNVNIIPVNMMPQYELMLDFLNLLSKWTYYESRYYCKIKILKEETWVSTYDNTVK